MTATLLEADTMDLIASLVFLAGGVVLLIYTLNRSIVKTRNQVQDDLARKAAENAYWLGMEGALDRLSTTCDAIEKKIEERSATLARLADEATEKIVRVRALLEEARAIKPVPPSEGHEERGKVVDLKAATAALVSRTHQRVYSLFDEGKNVEEISRETALQLGEIELILAIRDRMNQRSSGTG